MDIISPLYSITISNHVCQENPCSTWKLHFLFLFSCRKSIVHTVLHPMSPSVKRLPRPHFFCQMASSSQVEFFNIWKYVVWGLDTLHPTIYLIINFRLSNKYEICLLSVLVLVLFLFFFIQIDWLFYIPSDIIQTFQLQTLTYPSFLYLCAYFHLNRF